MTGNVVHVLERKYQSLQAQKLVAKALREAMEDEGLTAKELSRLSKAATGETLDYRTIQNAVAGTACSLETYFTLCGFFGWSFNDLTMTPKIGASRIASLEKEIAHEKAIIGNKEAHLARLYAADRALGAASGGVLRLVGEENRHWPARNRV